MDRDDAKNHARQPDEQDANRVEDDGLLERRHFLGGHAHNCDMREHDGRERNQRVAEELFHRDALAGEERRSLRVGGEFAHDAVEAAEVF